MIKPNSFGPFHQKTISLESIKSHKFLPDPERSEISFYKTLKRSLHHIESTVEESQVELDIEIRRTPPKFAGTCRKNQSSYDNKREIFDSAQQIVKELGA